MKVFSLMSSEESGQALSEYAVLLSVVVAGLIIIVTSFSSNKILVLWNYIVTNYNP